MSDSFDDYTAEVKDQKRIVLFTLIGDEEKYGRV